MCETIKGLETEVSEWLNGPLHTRAFTSHLIVLTGVIGLLLLRMLPLTLTLPSRPPLDSIGIIAVFAFCGLLLNLLTKADRQVVYYFPHDSSKHQHITINTPNGR